MILMLCYSRSGGTLLNRVLGALPNTVVVSEVSEYGGGQGKLKDKSFTTIQEQSKFWFDIELEEEHYYDAIKELNEKCNRKGKTLVLREWTWIHFNKHKKLANIPSRNLETFQNLIGSENLNLKSFVLLRNPVDVWLSSGTPSSRTFFAKYIEYCNSIKKSKLKMFYYEDLLNDPEKFTKELCDFTGLKFSESYQQFYAYDKVNGDSQKSHSRGYESTSIKKFSRKKMPIKYCVSLLLNHQFRHAMKLTNYSILNFLKQQVIVRIS